MRCMQLGAKGLSLGAKQASRANLDGVECASLVTHTSMTREWKVTPSLRVAAFSHLNKHGKEVLVDSDLRTKLCRHGEMGSTIRNWLHTEARARAEGVAPPPRPSICDCTSTHGLQNRLQTRPSIPPTCVYDALASACAKSLDVSDPSGPALQLLLTPTPCFVSAQGCLFCVHGRRLQPQRFDVQRKRPCVFRVAPSTKGASKGIIDERVSCCKCIVRLPKRMARLDLGRNPKC